MSLKKRRLCSFLFRRYYVAQFFGEYEYIEKSIFCIIYGEPFVSYCTIPMKKGWSAVLSCYEKHDNDGLPNLLDNEPIFCQEVRIDKRYTKNG